MIEFIRTIDSLVEVTARWGYCHGQFLPSILETAIFMWYQSLINEEKAFLACEITIIIVMGGRKSQESVSWSVNPAEQVLICEKLIICILSKIKWRFLFLLISIICFLSPAPDNWYWAVQHELKERHQVPSGARPPVYATGSNRSGSFP